MCFEMVHSNTKIAKSRVCQSQVCYLRTTHSSALKRRNCPSFMPFCHHYARVKLLYKQLQSVMFMHFLLGWRSWSQCYKVVERTPNSLFFLNSCSQLKGAQSYFFNFFPNFWRFWYHREAHIFPLNAVKFHDWKLFCLEDIHENVTGYGNHNKLTQ